MQLSATNKIRIIMMKADIKQPELARLLGVTRQSINSMLDKNNMSERTLNRLCKVLNCSFDIVFTMNDTKEKI